MFNFKHLDGFASAFTFNATNKEEKFKTKSGACLSLLCYSLTFIGILRFTGDYLNTKNPKITIESKKSSSYPEIKFKENNLFPAFTASSGKKILTSEELSRFITPVALKYSITQNPDLEIGFNYEIKDRQKFIDCKSTQLLSDFNETLESSGFMHYYNAGAMLCPENLENDSFWKVSGSGNKLPYSHIKIVIFPCSLEESSNCASFEEVTDIELSFSFNYNIYNLSNKEDPVDKLFEYNFESFSLNPTISQIRTVNLRLIKIIDETWDFLNGNLKAKFFNPGKIQPRSKYRDSSTYCSKTDSPGLSCKSYVELNIKSGSQISTITRDYPKLFSMISELGGFGEMIFVFVGTIYFFISKKFFYRKWIKGFFFDEKYKKKCLKEINSYYGGEKISSHKLDDMKDEFIREASSATDLMVFSKQFQTLIKMIVSKHHAKVLQIFPLLEKIEKKFHMKKLTKKKEENKIKYNSTLKDSIDYVKDKKPSNEIEMIIKVELEKMLKNLQKRKEEETWNGNGEYLFSEMGVVEIETPNRNISDHADDNLKLGLNRPDRHLTKIKPVRLGRKKSKRRRSRSRHHHGKGRRG